MKKCFAVLLIIVSLTNVFAINSFAEDNLSVYINDEKIEFEISAQIIDGRTMVPMREIYEDLGAVVGWFEDSNEIWSLKDKNVVRLNINQNIIFVNSDEIELDVSPCVVNDHTLVPLRAVSESFGADVEWNGENRSVYIKLNVEKQFCSECSGTGFLSENVECKKFSDNLLKIRNDLQTAIVDEKLQSSDVKEIYGRYIESLNSYENHILECKEEKIKCSICDGEGEVLKSEVPEGDALKDSPFQKLVSCIKDKGRETEGGYAFENSDITLLYNEKNNTVSLISTDRVAYELIVNIDDSEKVNYHYRNIKSNEYVKGNFIPQILIKELDYIPYFECNVSSSTAKQITKDATAEIKMSVVKTEDILTALDSELSLSYLGFVVEFADIDSEEIEEEETEEEFDWYIEG